MKAYIILTLLTLFTIGCISNVEESKMTVNEKSAQTMNFMNSSDIHELYGVVKIGFNQSGWCTATAISKYFLLTSAHCITEYPTNDAIIADDIVTSTELEDVYISYDGPFNNFVTKTYLRGTHNIELHINPEYIPRSSKGYKEDAMLVYFPDGLNFLGYNDFNYIDADYDNRFSGRQITSGYGYNDNILPADRVGMTIEELMSEEGLGNQNYTQDGFTGNNVVTKLTNSYYALKQNKTQACIGDSGTSLFYRYGKNEDNLNTIPTESGTFYTKTIAGIASYVTKYDENYCATTDSELYVTRALNIASWVRRTVKDLTPDSHCFHKTHEGRRVLKCFRQ